MEALLSAAPNIRQHFEDRNYNRAVREIIALADKVNQFIDDKQPWTLAKEATNDAQVHRVCSDAIQAFRILMCYLSPILPEMATNASDFLNTALTFQSLESGLLAGGHKIDNFKPLMQRIEAAAVEALVSSEAAESSPTDQPKKAKLPALDTQDQIDFESFAKVDLRVAEIVAAETIEEADKLLRLTVSLGDTQRTIIAGIKSAYSAEQLVGRQIVVVANLAPRTMRFGVSEGMALAAGPGGGDLFLISPDSGAKAGMQVK
jgi:methionyl-tRNA synthetase